MANKVKFNFDADAYKNPDILVNEYSSKELRAEYSRLRSIARKRLERFGASKWAERSKVYKRYKNQFTALPDIKRTRTVARKLIAVAKYLNLKTSTIVGFREDRKEKIAALQKHDYYWINEKNFDAFTDFMDYNRELRVGGEYDSERVLALVREATNKNLDPNQLLGEFQFWMDNLNKLEAIPDPPEKSGTSWQSMDASAYFREKLGGKG